jgi:hypothetical protein
MLLGRGIVASGPSSPTFVAERAFSERFAMTPSLFVRIRQSREGVRPVV